MNGGSSAVLAEAAAAPAAYRSTLTRLVPGLCPCTLGDALRLDAPIAIWGEAPALVDALDGLGLRLCDADTDGEIGGLILVASPDSDANRSAFTVTQGVADRLRARLAAGKPAVLAAVVALDGGLGFATGDLAIPASAGLAGLVKTAAREWDGLHARVIDPGQADPATVADALLRSGPVEIALGEGCCRAVILAEEGDQPRDATPIAPRDGIVVSGGARGVTADVAVALAARFRCRFLLLGRSAVPRPLPDWVTPDADDATLKRGIIEQEGIRSPKAIQARCKELTAALAIHTTCLRIHQAGGHARYAAADAGNALAVQTAIASFRSEGPVRGLVHGAGVLADRYIVDQTGEQWDLVYNTKVAGFQAMLDACASDDLGLLIGFSSSTARFGRTGQVAYAMGNEVLAKRLRHEAARRPTCRCIAADWGPWDGGMVTPELKTLFAAEGIQVIPRADGAAWCADAAATAPGGAVETVILGAGSSLPTEDLGADISIAVDSMPLLADHVIDGKAVLPAAWAAEILAACGGLGTGAGLRIADGAVLKGLALAAGASAQLSHLTDDGTTTLFVGERPAYRARIERRALQPSLPSLAPQGLETIDGDWYADRRLFHGPALQLVTAAAANEQSIRVDVDLAGLGRPAAIDALFQALILWSWRRHDAPCLPLGWDAIDVFADDLPDTVTITAQIVDEQGMNLVANAEVTVGDLLCLRISGARATVSAGLRAAFAANRL